MTAAFWDAPEWLTAPVLADLVAADLAGIDPKAWQMLAWSAAGWMVVIVAAVAIAAYLGWQPPVPGVRLAVEDDLDEDESAIDIPLDAPEGTAVVKDGPDLLLRPVNEPRNNRWPGLDRALRRQSFFDEESRRSNEAVGQWITDQRQKELGQSLAAQTERWLAAETARQARWDSATTQEIKRGDPGE